jgi:CBS domain-containing protein
MSPPVEAALTGYGRTVSPDASATDAARTLRDSDVSILVVEDDGIEGVVTESDFVSMVAETTDPVSVSEIMSSPPVTASPTTPVSTVAEEMRCHGVERVPVVDDGTYWGFVSTESVAFHFGTDDIDVDGSIPAVHGVTAPVTSD